MDMSGSNIKKPTSGKQNNQDLQVMENTFLMEFLMKQLPHKSRNNIKALLGYKQVFVDGKPVTQFNHPLVPGQIVEITTNRVSPEQKFKEYSIIYEDQYIIVIDKAAGLLSMATDSEKRATAYSLLSRHVKKQDPENKIFIVHRLDRETSGLMIFAKNEEIKDRLQEFWNDTILERTYVAVVEGMVGQHEGVITSYLWEDKNYTMHSSQIPGKGQKAVTHYSVVRQNDSYSLLKVNLETGRKKQIRIHMQELGHSIAGDKKYGAVTSPLKRLGLHAQQLSFIHPVSGSKMNFETKIPKAFMRVF
jgi:23S rRNA pseudouridine1911/1915/1917 synthase